MQKCILPVPSFPTQPKMDGCSQLSKQLNKLLSSQLPTIVMITVVITVVPVISSFYSCQDSSQQLLCLLSPTVGTVVLNGSRLLSGQYLTNVMTVVGTGSGPFAPALKKWAI